MFTLLLVLASFGIAVILIASPSAFADTAYVHREIDFDVQTTDGIPSMCSIQFLYAFKDFTYQTGQMTGMGGAFALTNVPDGRIMMMIKMGGLDFTGPQESPKRTPFPLAEASVTVDGVAIHPVVTTCLDQNNFCGVFSMKDASPILNAIARPDQSHALLNFNRVAGGLDYSFEIDQNPDAGQDQGKYIKEGAEFRKCFAVLIERFKKGAIK